MKRSCGILLHISSLPSCCGIGALGREAYEFVDFLVAAGQRYWQVLPLGHTGYGDSPYQVFSMFAGNPYFIDLDTLARDGLLLREELEAVSWGDDPEAVDYGAIYAHRGGLLHKAFGRCAQDMQAALWAFRQKQGAWLEDYALFMALKEHFGMRPWTEWDEDIRLHRSEAAGRYRTLLEEACAYFVFLQYLFFSQWERLKAYAAEKGIRLIGDLPIYAAYDSADVWSRPEYFLLDEERRPIAVAGVPPDFFSDDGQLWGNPLYRWDVMEQDGYALWMDRLEMAQHMYDVIRIDHFRGLASYWRVPYPNLTARSGEWVRGPGEKLIDAMRARFPELDVIAEDLGYLTPEVFALRNYAGYPGMKVLEFAFDRREPSNYLPHTYTNNCVCYTGTHDNATLAGWLNEIPALDAAYAAEYAGLNEREGAVWGLIRAGMSSVADLFMTQMQDYLGLDNHSRMNVPGTVGGNWRWRMKPGAASPALAEKLVHIARLYGRDE